MPRRLDQILSNFGYCSRSHARGWLKTGRVLVDGQRVKDPSIKVEPTQVTVDGAAIDHPEGIWIVLHKPVGYVCSHDTREGPSIYDLLPAAWRERDPQPTSVGRLDKDTSGLLLVTDDGPLVHRLTSPKHHVEKTYVATVDRDLDPGLAVAFASGELTLEGEQKPCLPARFRLLEARRAELVLTEGRYHQVRRMFASQGWTVTTLHRPHFGPLSLQELASGTWRDLTCAELGLCAGKA